MIRRSGRGDGCGPANTIMVDKSRLSHNLTGGLLMDGFVGRAVGGFGALLGGVLRDNIARAFINGVGRDNAADHRQRIDLAVAAND